MDPTIGYRLITFPDVKAAPYSTNPVDGNELRDRIVYARTRSGSWAKFQAIRHGNDLEVSRLTVYDESGFVERYTPSFLVRALYAADLETGAR